MEIALLIVSTVAALSGVGHLAQRAVYRRRVHVLEQLLAVAPGFCRSCGCTDAEACVGGCWWAEDDLCSSCADDDAIRHTPGVAIIGDWFEPMQGSSLEADR